MRRRLGRDRGGARAGEPRLVAAASDGPCDGLYQSEHQHAFANLCLTSARQVASLPGSGRTVAGIITSRSRSDELP